MAGKKVGKNSVVKVVKSGLCHGCGNCYNVCSHGAIRIDYNTEKGIFLPQIHEDKCTQCGLCVEVCSGKGFDFGKMYLNLFERQPEDAWLGINRKIYTANASDLELRKQASSGGVLSAMLIFLLDKKKVDGVIVTRFSHNNPLLPETFIARSAQEIIQAKGSKYCPVSANKILSDAMNSGGKYAFVGLPCHIQSLRLLQEEKPEYRLCIPYVFGLMCSNTSTAKGTEYFLKKHNINPDYIRALSYRGQGWIGYIRVLTDKKEIMFSRTPAKLKEKIMHAVAFHTSFSMKRCLTCCDHTCEFADISFGDPRFKEYLKAEKTGKTLVLIRSESGEAIYNEALSAGYIINDWQLNGKEFYKGQNISFKKAYGSHLRFNKFIGAANPEYHFKVIKPGKNSMQRILHYYPSYWAKNSFAIALLYPYALMFRTVLNKGFMLYPFKKLMKKILK